MSSYTPNNWVIVTITKPEETIRKVLAEWKGGYLHGDEWRLSSGITEIHDRGDYYEIHNESGSVYACHKSAERLGILSGSIFNQLCEQGAAQGAMVALETLGED